MVPSGAVWISTEFVDQYKVLDPLQEAERDKCTPPKLCNMFIGHAHDPQIPTHQILGTLA